MPAATSDLYSFCILAQEVFTGELPWAGRKGPEVKAKLEAGESPTLDPLVPAPYQALVQAGLGLGPADRWGSLQNTRYLLREAMAQDSAPEVSSPRHWTTRSPVSQGFLPETLYCEVAPRAQTTPGPVPPLMSLGPSPCQVGARAGIWRTRGATEHLGHSCQLLPLSLQALKTPEVTGHSRVQRATAWDSGSSLTLGSSPSPGLSVYPGSSPAARISPHCCLEPSSTGPVLHSSLQDSASLLGTQGSVEQFERNSAKMPALQGLQWHTHRAALLDPHPRPEPSPELIRGGRFSSLQKMDLLEEILAELRDGRRLGDKPSLDPAPDTDS
ncbi:uncharacterized protein LOC123793901 isoform X2 [Ursus americanus]|uniref:uncharacterized protein LOC123793901 isoform X2 n=1 Tax=Ursus americanus TaxID=9643 RepID=UPI001E67C0E3|nr:uncharacterized protein LOC123793901 isoform X2 [Ursus americanus]